MVPCLLFRIGPKCWRHFWRTLWKFHAFIDFCPPPPPRFGLWLTFSDWTKLHSNIIQLIFICKPWSIVKRLREKWSRNERQSISRDALSLQHQLTDEAVNRMKKPSQLDSIEFYFNEASERRAGNLNASDGVEMTPSRSIRLLSPTGIQNPIVSIFLLFFCLTTPVLLQCVPWRQALLC